MPCNFGRCGRLAVTRSFDKREPIPDPGRYWDVGESAHFFFHMETGETRWVAPGEEDEYEAGEGQEGQEEGGAAGDAAAAHEEGGGVGFGQVGGEGEWAREYGGKAFPAGAWAALGDSAAAPKYLDPEVSARPASSSNPLFIFDLVRP